MSKIKSKPVNDETQKPEVRRVSEAHAKAVADAASAALQREAAVGRGFMEVYNLMQAASQANQETQGALVKAALSVGIDPSGEERWSWDAAAMGYVRVT